MVEACNQNRTKDSVVNVRQPVKKLYATSLRPLAYCCVPHCRSDGKQRISGVSFHEIPAEETARQQCIMAIRRDDWVPNMTSNYSSVCNKHFMETDFAEGKRRRLKKGVIPTVFPDYISYLRPSPLKERTTESIQKRSASHVYASTGAVMVYCCVPYCKSRAGKTPGVSFHQFPVDQELCSKWQWNISRQNLDKKAASRSRANCL
nr:uncharacterized protein LOC119185501 [Rhipicephalus microplus]